MSRGVKIVIGVLLTLVLLAVVADRVGLLVAELSAESKLASYAQFVDKPNVVIHGIPFLTQAIRGDYDDIQITSGAVQLDQMTGTNLNVHLRGAHIPLGDLIGGSVKQIPVDKVDGTVVVPYDALIARSGVPGLHLSSEGSQVVATGQITLPGTSLSLNITAKGTLDVADGKVRLNVSDVTANGATLYPIIAAPLVLVGTMMMGGLRHVEWDEPTESIPAFLTLILMPLAASVTEGIAFGVLSYVLLKLTSGRGREVHPLIYAFALLFLVRYVFIR